MTYDNNVMYLAYPAGTRPGKARYGVLPVPAWLILLLPASYVPDPSLGHHAPARAPVAAAATCVPSKPTYSLWLPMLQAPSGFRTPGEEMAVLAPREPHADRGRCGFACRCRPCHHGCNRNARPVLPATTIGRLPLAATYTCPSFLGSRGSPGVETGRLLGFFACPPEIEEQQSPSPFDGPARW